MANENDGFNFDNMFDDNMFDEMFSDTDDSKNNEEESVISTDTTDIVDAAADSSEEDSINESNDKSEVIDTDSTDTNDKTEDKVVDNNTADDNVTDEESVTEEPAVEADNTPKETTKNNTETVAEAATEDISVEPVETMSNVVEETEDKAPEPVVKKARKGRGRPKKQAKDADKTTVKADKAAERGAVDQDFMSTLNVTIGDYFEEQKKTATDMMNSIVISKGMDNDNISVMLVKKVELSKYIMAMSDKYENIKETLDESLIPRVRAEAEMASNGTAADKKNAGVIALTNYIDPKTKKKHDLLELRAAVHAACRFCTNMKNFCDTTGMTLASMLKLN